MREELANLVHPVLAYGLRLKERVERKEPLQLHVEQANLKRLLLNESEARRWPDYGGEDSAFTNTGGMRVNPEHYLGMRYALVCWLDEMFIYESPWSRQWNDARLEDALYGTNARNGRFWHQARLAESRAGSDALEGFYLCVMLGFRGDRRNQIDLLTAWAEVVGKRLSREHGRECELPAELEPPFNAPPLHGRDRLRRMALCLITFLALVLPFLAFFVISRVRG